MSRASSLALFRDRQRVDLQKLAVLLQEQPVQVPDDLRERFLLLRIQPEGGGELARLKRTEPHGGMDRAFDDLLRGRRCHLLDVHAARLRGHEHHALLSPRTVDDQAQVELLPDGGCLFHQNLAHLFPSGPVWWVTSCIPRIDPGGRHRPHPASPPV